MTQLIIEGLKLPEVTKGSYSAHYKPLNLLTEMASGRMTIETKGFVWMVYASYYYIPDEDGTIMPLLLRFLRRGDPIIVSFLPDDSKEMVTAKFIVTELSNPSYFFESDGIPYWTGLSFTLREEEPHD